jgi:hypothetical protein
LSAIHFLPQADLKAVSLLLRAQSQSRRTPFPAFVDFVRPAGWGGTRPARQLTVISGIDFSSQHAFVGDFVSRRILLPHKDFSFSYPTKECDSLTSMSDFSHLRQKISQLWSCHP